MLFLRISLLLSMLLFVGGCGQKGPLYLPSDAPVETGSQPDNRSSL